MTIEQFTQIARNRVASAKILLSVGLDILATKEISSLNEIVDLLYNTGEIDYTGYKKYQNVISSAGATVFPLL